MHSVCQFVERVICHPELFLVVATYFAALTFSVVFWRGRLARVYQRHWYDLSYRGPNEEMSFLEIKKVMDRDPLEKHFRPRLPLKYVVVDTVILLVIVLVTCCLILVIFNYPEISVENNLRLVIPGGLLALFGGIVVASYQVRLRARSANRQEWINAMRAQISVLIDSFPPPSESRRSIEETNIKIKQHFMKLELYLNPSEKVHRAFVEVLRFMYGFQCSERMSPDNSRKLCIRKQLCIPESRLGWAKIGEDCAEAEWKSWQLRAVRLANVLLKREWEQVKHVK